MAAFRAVLEERTRDRVPLQWATTQTNLGNALATLGARESGTARLEEAVAAFRAALEERTRDRVPLQWAMTQMNLGGSSDLRRSTSIESEPAATRVLRGRDAGRSASGKRPRPSTARRVAQAAMRSRPVRPQARPATEKRASSSATVELKQAVDALSARQRAGDDPGQSTGRIMRRKLVGTLFAIPGLMLWRAQHPRQSWRAKW